MKTLSHNIIQSESSLQTKRTEQAQTPSPNLQTEINQLEQKLTTYKAQKQKIETLLPKIVAQINNLSKEENNPQQESIIQNLEKDIQEINQELGIKSDKPKPTPRKLPDDKKGPDLPNSSYQDLLDDIKTIHAKLTKSDNKDGLQEIKKLQADLKTLSLSPQEVVEKRTELRKKWANLFNPESPSPNPQLDKKWENKRRQLLNEFETKERRVRKHHSNNILWEVMDDELKDPDYYDKLLKAPNETEFNRIKQATLKDITEIKIGSPVERLKLKDYFTFCFREVEHHKRPDKKINVRELEENLINDLNQMIKGNPNSTWQRKYMTFIGDFKINSQADATKFDNWVKSDDVRKTWVVIKKNHNPSQWDYEKNYLFLKKGEPDYHEFKTRKEAIDFLRKNDSYFKSA